MSDQILLNRICTPDGTVITSYHRHDYKTHEDANGETYMVDGGSSYLKRNVNKELYEDLSVYLTEDHVENRKAFHWGTYGPEGDQPLQWRPLSELSTDHVEAIINTQHQLKGTYSMGLFLAEIEYREGLDQI